MAEENPFGRLEELERSDRRAQELREGQPTTSQPGQTRSWLLGCGCGCLLALIVVAGSCAWIVTKSLDLLRQSEPVLMALAIASSDPDLQEALGSPLEVGIPVPQVFVIQDDSGEAVMRIPLSGPRGKAQLHVEAERSAGQWRLTSLYYILVDTPDIRYDLPLDEPYEIEQP